MFKTRMSLLVLVALCVMPLASAVDAPTTRWSVEGASTKSVGHPPPRRWPWQKRTQGASQSTQEVGGVYRGKPSDMKEWSTGKQQSTKSWRNNDRGAFNSRSKDTKEWQNTRQKQQSRGWKNKQNGIYSGQSNKLQYKPGLFDRWHETRQGRTAPMTH
jgi:hypothetical protein